MTSRMQTFAEFWPFYLREHAQPLTRSLHFAGTTLATATIAGAVVTQTWPLLIAAPFLGYGFAWYAHFVIEKNRPATFKYPLWSFAADYKMLAYAIAGKLRSELERAGAPAQKAAA